MILVRRATRLVAALALAGAATIGLASQPAQATTPTHVGIVVDFGGGKVQAACVPGGGSGSAVLGAGFQVTYNGSGLVAIINGVGTMSPPTTLYWSYWHSAGGSWSYATTGPASFTPPAGTVEGWAYNDGSVGPAVAPSYASICAGQDPTPAPPATHPATQPPATHHPSSPPGQPGQPAPHGGTTPAAAGPSNGRGTSTPSGSGTSSSSSSTHDGTATASSSNPSTAAGYLGTSNGSEPTVKLVAAAAKAKHVSAAPALGAGLALLAALSIGGAAYWRLRGQRQN